jgi:hypothetical protein
LLDRRWCHAVLAVKARARTRLGLWPAPPFDSSSNVKRRGDSPLPMRQTTWPGLFRRTLSSASVHVREVVKECLWRGAASVVLSHNHPSEKPEPSVADERITRQ